KSDLPYVIRLVEGEAGNFVDERCDPWKRMAGGRRRKLVGSDGCEGISHQLVRRLPRALNRLPGRITRSILERRSASKDCAPTGIEGDIQLRQKAGACFREVTQQPADRIGRIRQLTPHLVI